jgi:phage shock protein PspC (stress-responsive transcriptional regulator)
MQILFRPHEGRIVGGVARALSERFGVPLFLTRVALATIVLSSPYGALLYVLLWVAMPGERRVLPQLEVDDSYTRNSYGFTAMSARLLDRFRGEDATSILSAVLAFVMLYYAVMLQLNNLNPVAFYYEHPILSLAMTSLERVSSVVAYLSLALLFFFTRVDSRQAVSFWQAPRPRLELDATSSRVIFGLMSGLARVLNVDPFVLRVLAVMLSLLTFGVAAVIYVVAVILLDRRSKEIQPGRLEGSLVQSPRFPQKTMRGIASIFLILAITKLATEYRFFFFNEPYVHGVLYIVLGAIVFFWSLKQWNEYSGARLWMLIGPAVIFWGIYELSTALFHVQLPFAARFQVGYLIAGTAFIYYSIATLRGKPVLFGVAVGVFFYLLAMVVQFNVIPSNVMLLAVQFYEFFYPVIFGAAGLWVVMEK